MIEAIQKFLSVPENAKSVVSVALNLFVILAVVVMTTLTPTVVNGLLGGGVLASTFVLGRIK